MPLQTPITTAVGNLLPQCQRVIYKFDPVRGWIYQYEWDGVDQDAGIQLSNWYALNGVANELTLERDKFKLNATDSTQEYAIDSWEIVATEDSPALFSNPTLVYAIAEIVGFSTNPGAPSSIFTDIMTTLNQGIQSQSDLFSISDDPYINTYFTYGGEYGPDDIPWTPNGLVLAQYYSLALQGATSFFNPQYVLKHKYNVSNRWTVQIYDWGVNQIYTTAQLLTEVGSGGLWIFPLPPSMQFTLSNIPVPLIGQVPTSTSGQQWGWFKSASTRTTEALNRVNIESSYTLALAPTVLYPPYDGVSGGGDS